MNDKRKAGLEVAAAMLGSEAAEEMVKAAKSGAFAGEMGELALDAVFGTLWTRPGLSRRDRSLVTLGILIALRATGEMR